MTITLPPPGWENPHSNDTFEEALIRRIMLPADACYWCQPDKCCAYCCPTEESQAAIRERGEKLRHALDTIELPLLLPLDLEEA